MKSRWKMRFDFLMFLNTIQNEYCRLLLAYIVVNDCKIIMCNLLQVINYIVVIAVP